jgi:ribosome maturation factor RimP
VGLWPTFLFAVKTAKRERSLTRKELRRPAPTQASLDDLIAPVVEGLGYVPVRLRVTGKVRPSLQVMAERADGSPVTVDDCAAISRALSPVLEATDPFAGAYTLEVSSTGIDRPLVRRGDFERFAGQDVEIVTRELIDGRRRFSGRLLGIRPGGAAGEEIEVATPAGSVPIALANIQDAKLAFPSELKFPVKPPRRGGRGE